MYIPEAAIYFCKVSGIDHTHSVNYICFNMYNYNIYIKRDSEMQYPSHSSLAEASIPMPYIV